VISRIRLLVRCSEPKSAEEAPPSLESEVLFTADFVCLVGGAVPVRARRLTLKQYLEFQHVLVEIRDGQQALVDRALLQLGVKRRVALALPFYVPAIFAIAQTDLILTVPRRLAEITADGWCTRRGSAS